MEFDNNILLIIGAVVLGVGILFFKIFYSNKSSPNIEVTDKTSTTIDSQEEMNCDADKCYV
jgi:hypothetical protein